MKKTKKTKQEFVEISKEELTQLVNQLEETKAKEQRSLADYQNLIRRTREERLRIIKLAAQDFVDSLIQPLTHLSLASEQINNDGLDMVVTQLWQVLEENGLKKIDCIGKKFDIETMEVIERGKKGNKVIKIVKEGYLLNDEVVQHAKVILD